jgi:hypothetical protein
MFHAELLPLVVPKPLTTTAMRRSSGSGCSADPGVQSCCWSYQRLVAAATRAPRTTGFSSVV